MMLTNLFNWEALVRKNCSLSIRFHFTVEILRKCVKCCAVRRHFCDVTNEFIEFFTYDIVSLHEIWLFKDKISVINVINFVNFRMNSNNKKMHFNNFTIQLWSTSMYSGLFYKHFCVFFFNLQCFWSSDVKLLRWSVVFNFHFFQNLTFAIDKN